MAKKMSIATIHAEKEKPRQFTMPIIPLLIFLLAFVLPVHSQEHSKAASAAPTQKKQVLSDDDMRRYQYFWLEAVRLEDMGKYADAYEFYLYCLHINPDAAEAHFAVAMFEHAFEHDSLALYHLEKACELDADNDEFAEKLAQFYLAKDQVDEATKVYQRLSEMVPDRTDYIDMLVRIYEHQKDYPKMLEALNRMEVMEGKSEEMTLAKMQVFSYMGDTQGAYDELNSLIKQHPNDLNYKVMMGNWLLSNGRKIEALKAFQDVLKEEPDHAQGQMSLMDYYRMDGKTEEADRLLYEMLENPRTETSTRITLMQQVVRDSESDDGDSLRILNIFNHVLALPQKSSEMAEMKAEYMIMKSMPEDSIKCALRQVLDISPENVACRLRLLEILWEDTIDAQVVHECEKAVEYSPDEPALYYYLGLAKYLTDDNEGSLDALQRGVRMIGDDTPAGISSRMYMIMGDILHTMGKPDEAYAAYDSCLTYNPDEIACLNNYAYYLSEENRDLKRAEMMSYKTIKAEPQNGTYLDTYAWILYMQERYEEAKIYIDQVLIVDSAEVNDVNYDHSGDIYIKLGKTDEAIQFWNKALELEAENADEIKKKINKAKGKK